MYALQLYFQTSKEQIKKKDISIFSHYINMWKDHNITQKSIEKNA